MSTFRVYIRRKTTLPPQWDWIQTVVAKDQQAAIVAGYNNWVASGPHPAAPPLADCIAKAEPKANRFESNVTLANADRSVQYYSQDILADQPYRDEVMQADAGDISGCVQLIGPVQVCYVADLHNFTFEISLKVGGVTVFNAELSKDHPCVTLNGNYGIAKWNLSVCLDVNNKQLRLAGSACVTFLGCKSFNVVLFHW